VTVNILFPQISEKVSMGIIWLDSGQWTPMTLHLVVFGGSMGHSNLRKLYFPLELVLFLIIMKLNFKVNFVSSESF